ncbi:MAG: MogA/MoaB family molybdenum cofactor biosynthesis protein [Planctomycetes bacterium]|nr:MogA/MoaB family molybdenum cofactor biosynthesis protein [Planctomycetota bacterium]
MNGAERARLSVALLLCSDRAASGARDDATAALLAPALAAAGHVLATTRIVPDELPAIAAALRELALVHPIVLTSGGTGLARRDVTVEATRSVIEREVPGIGEAMRARSLAVTPMAMVSRATAGTLGGCLIINLPGSPRGALDCLEVVVPIFAHAARLLAGAVRDCQVEVAAERAAQGAAEGEDRTR